jgi:hypothetical protein
MADSFIKRKEEKSSEKHEEAEPAPLDEDDTSFRAEDLVEISEEGEDQGLALEIDNNDLIHSRNVQDGSSYKLFIIYPDTRFKLSFDILITMYEDNFYLIL